MDAAATGRVPGGLNCGCMAAVGQGIAGISEEG